MPFYECRKCHAKSGTFSWSYVCGDIGFDPSKPIYDICPSCLEEQNDKKQIMNKILEMLGGIKNELHNLVCELKLQNQSKNVN